MPVVLTHLECWRGGSTSVLWYPSGTLYSVERGLKQYRLLNACGELRIGGKIQRVFVPLVGLRLSAPLQPTTFDCNEPFLSSIGRIFHHLSSATTLAFAPLPVTRLVSANAPRQLRVCPREMPFTTLFLPCSADEAGYFAMIPPHLTHVSASPAQFMALSSATQRYATQAKLCNAEQRLLLIVVSDPKASYWSCQSHGR